MKTRSLLTLASAFAFAGCVIETHEHHRPPPPRQEVVVVHDDPPPRQETVVVEQPAPPPRETVVVESTPAAQPVAATDDTVEVTEVEEVPPALQEEVITIDQRPGPTYAWQHGFWRWRHRWEWVRGHWVVGRAGCHWVSGHWEQRGRNFHWIPGHWVEDAQITEERPGLLVATSAPPGPYSEVVYIQLRPSPRHVWIHGHWAWHGHWVWIHGHWHVGRAGSNWEKGHWVARDGRWHWVAGHWTVETQVTEETPGELEATSAPPAPYAESIVIETRPGPTYTWIHGHWAWHGHWVWVHGHWHLNQVGHVWVHGHWVARGGRWHWEPGRWVVEAQVTEERPGELVCHQAPPAPYRETVIVELRPSPSHVWIAGHWAWHGHWVWEHGHWHPCREGHRWQSGHWEHRGAQWHWSVGIWIR